MRRSSIRSCHVGDSCAWAAALPPNVHDRHVFFENSAAEGGYYRSDASVVAPSELEIDGGKVPVESDHFKSPPNCAAVEMEIWAGRRLACAAKARRIATSVIRSSMAIRSRCGAIRRKSSNPRMRREFSCKMRVMPA